MNKIIKNSFLILFRNSAIIQPIILFTLILIIFPAIALTKLIAHPNLVLVYFGVGLLVFSAFLSGWAYMIKYAVENYLEIPSSDKAYPLLMANYNIETLKKFFTGVGEYFLPVLGTIILNIIGYIGLIKLGEILFSVKYLSIVEGYAKYSATNVMPEFSAVQFLFLLFLNGMLFVLMFLTLFWLPSLFNKTKNPVWAFFVSLKYLFTNFLISIGTYLILFGLFIFINILSFLSLLSPVFSLILMIIVIYYITFYYVLSFSIFRYFMTKEIVNEINKKDVFIKSNGADNGNFPKEE